jgi:hypothetical protein
MLSWNNLRRVMIRELPDRSSQKPEDRLILDLDDLLFSSFIDRARLLFATALVWDALVWKLLSPVWEDGPLYALEARYELGPASVGKSRARVLQVYA